MTDWSAALDLFEERLDAFRSVLAEDGAPPASSWPPADLIGIPLPRELAERATGLVTEAYELEQALVTARQTRRPTAKANGYRRPITARATISAKL